MIVTTQYDTVTKELKVIKGGEEVPNLTSISFYANYDSKWSMEMCQSEYSEEEKMSERHCTYAEIADLIYGKSK